MRKAGALFLFASLVLACGNTSQDIFPPVIEQFELSTDSVSPLSPFQVFVQVSDDEELNQMRFRVREAFAKTYTPWSEVRVLVLDGRTHQGTYTFTAPDSAMAGMYELGLQVVDQQGNSSLDSLRKFFVLRPGEQPVFENFTTNPAPGSTLEIELFDTSELTFSGLITDLEGLRTVNIEFKRPQGTNVRVFNYAISDSSLVWDAALLADTVLFTTFPELPASLVVKALNINGHQSRLTFPLSFQ